MITGAFSGIREATAKRLASHGNKIVLGARRTNRLKQSGEASKKDGGEVVYKVTDVTSRLWHRPRLGCVWPDELMSG